jgi:neutral ceramidase
LRPVPSSHLRAGNAIREITPALGTPLAGRPSWGPRRALRIRDPLFARALHFDDGVASITIVAADLVLVTSKLAQAVATAAGLPPESLFLCATHTHSGPGGFWGGAIIEAFMGTYDVSAEAALVDRLAAAARDAAGTSAPATLAAATVHLDHASFNRRLRGGPVDPSLTLLEIDVAGQLPVSVVVYGSHPTAGVDAEPGTITADYPGELCRRLEQRGFRPIFLQGMAAGVGPGFPVSPLDEHLGAMGDALEAAVERARAELVPIDGCTLAAQRLPIAIPPGQIHMLPAGPTGRGALEVLAFPLRTLAGAMARQGRLDNPDLALQLAQFGGIALLGVPSEVGPGVGKALRALLRDNGATVPVVVSMCNGYAGYVHRRSDYDLERWRDLLPLALYENLMGAGGWELGEGIVAALDKLLSVLPSRPTPNRE